MQGKKSPEDDLQHTADTVAEIIRNKIEPESAEAVLTILKKYNGQPITTRLLDKLPGGRVEWRVSRGLGWTELKNRAYINSGGAHPDGICLILTRTETANTPLDAELVERENPAYFAGRRQRNALRLKALEDRELLTRVAALFNKHNALREAFLQEQEKCRSEFSVFVAHGGPLSPDQYDLERAAGLREDPKP